MYIFIITNFPRFYPEQGVFHMENEIVVNGEALSPETAAVGGGIIGASLAIVLIACLVFYIIRAIGYWKVFVKAGKPGWHSLIPYLNTWDQIDLAWNSKMAWVNLGLTLLTSIMSPIMQNNQDSTVLVIIACILVGALFIIDFINTYKTSKAFGKGIAFFIGLLFLNPIFIIILGFGDSEYQGRQA